MRTVAYIRISTGGQGLDSQRLAILDYAHRQGLTVHTFVEAQVSSRHAGARRGLDAVLEQVQSGDLLLVSELSRLGRSVGQIIQLVDRLLKQRVQLVAIKEHIRLNGTQDLQTKVMITLFGLFAEIERALIAERTKEGLAAARAQGFANIYRTLKAGSGNAAHINQFYCVPRALSGRHAERYPGLRPRRCHASADQGRYQTGPGR